MANPIRKLNTELNRLRSLYIAVLFAFSHIDEKSFERLKKNNLGFYSSVLKFSEFEPENSEKFEPENSEKKVFDIKRKMKSQFPRYLRETVFVRLISSLEVFLIDVVKEIFLVRKDLFQTQNKIEFSAGEIFAAESLTDIWTKLINNELRKLQNQGFKEITKFYKTRLGIEFNKFLTSLSVIQEFHDRRHLLVHRLGKIDSQYRHQYNATKKTLSVPEDYLLNALDIINKFADFINVEAQFLVNEQNENRKTEQLEVKKRIVFEILNKEVARIKDKSFHYTVGDSIKNLGDILISYQSDDLKHILELKGKKEDLNEYVKIIKTMERRRQLNIFENKNIHINSNFVARRIKNVPIEIIEPILKTLPSLPFPRHIHKQIAEQFGISNSMAAAAINIILNDEKFLSEIGNKEVRE